MEIEILQPHGFCAGVTGALRRALKLADSSGGPLYCLHEIVHNALVVEDLRRRGFRFVEGLGEVPAGATVLFSAHGVSPEVRAEAAARALRVVDATCPFVERVHRAARAFAERGLPVVILGHPGHVEVQGIMGEVPQAVVLSPDAHAPLPADLPPRFGLVSQTTLSVDAVRRFVDALRARFDVEAAAEVCQATQERQDAVKAFAGDALLVLGSASSSNTRRLCEVARCRAWRAGTLEEVRALDFAGVRRLGVTSGASTPEEFFKAVVRELEERE